MSEEKRMQQIAGVYEEANPYIGQGKWKELSGPVLKGYQKQILDLIKIAYNKIGGHANFKSANDINTNDAKVWVGIDLDSDPDIDAVSVTKQTQFGKKSVGMGHDGTRRTKRKVIDKKITDLKTMGNYVEVSGALFPILKKAGVPIVTDEDTVRSVLKGKGITWNGDGTYSRKIGGKQFTKTMMGKPKV